MKTKLITRLIYLMISPIIAGGLMGLILENLFISKNIYVALIALVPFIIAVRIIYVNFLFVLRKAKEEK